MISTPNIGETPRTLGKVQGAPKGTLSHPCAKPTNLAQCYTREFRHHREGGPGPSQDHKGIYLHEGKQAHPQ